MEGDWIMTIKEADKELKEQLMNGNDQVRGLQYLQRDNEMEQTGDL